MNVKDSNTNTSEEEYQIIDASCFNIEAQDQGLEFNLNLPCPVCGSFQSNFICEKCINSGSFVHSRHPTSHNYSELCSRLKQVNLEIKLLTETLLARLPPKSNGPVEELKALIVSLEEAHAYNVEQNRKKRERRDQIRKRMIHCHTKSQQLSKNRCFLTKHYSSITQKRTILEKDFAKHSLHIERLRARYFKELLQSHFVAKLSVCWTFSNYDSFVSFPYSRRKRITFDAEDGPLLATCVMFRTTFVQDSSVVTTPTVFTRCGFESRLPCSILLFKCFLSLMVNSVFLFVM
ncbi:hypothetical protein PHET_11424 [Paragonimus heterotremus]|uniref:Uncharacterized protein n=1 Tax=Paragonimus heterotremus TaxID=100268 RepID=A0A8J4SYY3_9TREM|nr:hypothetical protein PHET_11424 [Paragonimus heterotremus]